jgi:hypothetical protein
MGQIPSWKANLFGVGQEIRRFLWKPKVPHRTHKRPPPVPFWATPIQSLHPHPTSWRSILILPSHLCLRLSSGLFPSGFTTKSLHTPLPSPRRATCPTNLILLDFITRTMLGKEYRPFSSTLCNFLHSPVTSSLLGPNIPDLSAITFIQCYISINLRTIKHNIALLFFLYWIFYVIILCEFEACHPRFVCKLNGWVCSQNTTVYVRFKCFILINQKTECFGPMVDIVRSYQDT